MSSPTVPDIEPVAYKFVGKYLAWLCNELAEADLKAVQPMYAPIEDEEN